MSLASTHVCYNLARSISKALKRRKTLYATGPIVIEDTAHVDVTTMDGRKYRIMVTEVEE